MFLFQKSNKKISSRRQIQIKEVKDNILILPNNQYRTIIETSSINFELKSEEEQDILTDSFQNFLNSLAIPLQIVIRIREIEIDHYLENMKSKQSKETENIYKNQMDNYADFIQKLVSGNKILSRSFYLVITYESKEKNDFDLMKEQLLLNQDIVIKSLEKLGMKARQLTSLEILDLFYSFYNPVSAKTQPITRQTIEKLLSL